MLERLSLDNWNRQTMHRTHRVMWVDWIVVEDFDLAAAFDLGV